MIDRQVSGRILQGARAAAPALAVVAASPLERGGAHARSATATPGPVVVKVMIISAWEAGVPAD